MFFSAIVIGALLLWIYALAFLCVYLDPDLDSVQRVGQTIVILIIPIVGPLFVLHIVNTHSPDTIRRLYIPWPFRDMVLGKGKKISKSDTDHDNYIEPASTRRSNYTDSIDDSCANKSINLTPGGAGYPSVSS